MANGTVVIDPGHGGTHNVGGSDANHAVSPSGFLEKNMTLRQSLEVRDALNAAAAAGGHTIRVIMTRDTDRNLSLRDRAGFARTHSADRFLSIHYNGFNKVSRGTETYVRRAADNTNLAADKRFAQRIQTAVFSTIRAHDPGANDRGVKEEAFGVLSDVSLGNTGGVRRCRACLLEVEFIDVKAVDQLLNLSTNAAAVRADIAAAIARAIIDDLQNP